MAISCVCKYRTPYVHVCSFDANQIMEFLYHITASVQEGRKGGGGRMEHHMWLQVSYRNATLSLLAELPSDVNCLQGNYTTNR